MSCCRSKSIRINWRVMLAACLLLLICFGLVHVEPLRNILTASVIRLKSNLKTLKPLTSWQSYLSLPAETDLGASGSKVCPINLRNLDPNMVHITIKTTQQFHGSRLMILVSTWITEAIQLKGKGNQSIVKISVVSDAVDDVTNAVLGGRMVKSRCPSSHNRTDLCCKQATEFDLYFAEKKPAKWYCHFDDDNYVNVYNLLDELANHDANRLAYLGKSSRSRAKLKNVISPSGHPPSVVFTFATGGAGFCLSRPAMEKIKPKVSRIHDGQGLEGLCRLLPGLADDVAVGYVTAFYNVPLKEVATMHSHLEKLSLLSQTDIQKAISLSYTRYRSYENTVRLSSFFTTQSSDPTRLISLHQFLQPKNCPS